MGTWNSRGLRGSTLEDMINHTNDLYREKKLALIQKIPTPITPVSPYHAGVFRSEEYRRLHRRDSGRPGLL